MSRFAVMDPETGDWVEVTEEGIRLGLPLAPTPPDALDVERLARAMRAISLIPSLYRGPVAAWVPTAEALAREYAALAATEGE